VVYDVRAYDSAAKWAIGEADRYRLGIVTLLLAVVLLVIVELFADSVRNRRRRRLMILSDATKRAIREADPARREGRHETSTGSTLP
jgi:hypothetical protein